MAALAEAAMRDAITGVYDPSIPLPRFVAVESYYDNDANIPTVNATYPPPDVFFYAVYVRHSTTGPFLPRWEGG